MAAVCLGDPIVWTLLMLLTVSVTECREMCYTCSYTINALKQGLECVHAPKNVTIGQWASQCPYECLIRSEITIDTLEIRSFNRMCGFDTGEERCEEHGPYEICQLACGEDFCNDGIMGLLKGAIEEEDSAATRTVSRTAPPLLVGTVLALLHRWG